MGQLSPRRHDDESAQPVAESGQQLWLATCTSCGQPLTIVARERPVSPQCTSCRDDAGA